MGLIFVLSLFAVSFPGISKKSTYLPIPKVVFFIGKHFGTGVILSTAFCHLLQDSFAALTSPEVSQEYGSMVGKQCGLIILASMLLIFLVEYISTSYVDHLHAEPSAPSSPAPTLRRLPSVPNLHHHCLTDSPLPTPLSEVTPLLTDTTHPMSSAPATIRHPPQHYLSSLMLNSPRHSRSSESFYVINDLVHHVNNGEYQLIGGRGGCVCVCVCPAGGENGQSRTKPGAVAIPMHEDPSEEEPPRIGRKRQVVGILVLQLGIMIHSLVIGLTLAITHGSEFTSLATAICFHQLFEGLSLGIRIAALPPSASNDDAITTNLLTRCQRNWLAPTLSFLFGITTPVGMGLGMAAFASSSHAQMQLTQGLMSAISAGMLIYAATVEMLAGDFVYGNLQGEHSHGEGGDEEHKEDEEHEEATPKRKAVALLSLLAGVACMGLIGIGE
ncbi:Zinc/iron permease [Hymenopellis radicata]|nr:Zinc/iron permease [Hymenopellis radicata]